MLARCPKCGKSVFNVERRRTMGSLLDIGGLRQSASVADAAERSLRMPPPPSSSIAASTGGKPEAWRAFGINSCRQKPSHRASALARSA